ncbi:MAG: GNAT family N-acetyltransferase [Candidatus Eisenbacteria bacterium]|uniref:GNAT family N-acetyltransferase n=1 Tax=Eiseniibacteriota bacterium TaxID=2212470 RepID=A0A849T1U5_UNCEI|nr:GNAT family N-acetyltransferase [Candidatus Eisenbacteria bacterium]
MDLDHVRRMERVEVAVWRDLVSAASSDVRRNLGLVDVQFAGGMALLCSRLPSVLFNRAFGFGLEQAVCATNLDDLIELYRYGGPFAIQPSPAVLCPGTATLLKNRGLPARSSWSCWTRTLDVPIEPVRAPIRVTRVRREQAETFAALTCGLLGEFTIAPWIAESVGRDRWTHYLALHRDEPVGAAALFVNGDDAWLSMGVTVEEYRNQGVQSVLIARRLLDAAGQGARWIRVETTDDRPNQPSPSSRIMQYAGFTLQYQRPSHVWLPPGLDKQSSPAE